MARNSELKKLAASWREIATGHYCQTYNKGMAEGLIKAAGELELHICNNSASERLRRTKRAVELGDSAESQALSQPEVLSTQQAESTPSPIH